MLTEFLGYHWIRLALPSDDGRNPYFHPPLLLPHIRDAQIAREVGNQGHTSAPGHLSGCLLHPARLHLPPAIHGLAPTTTPAVLQRLVLLPYPGGAVQHQHDFRHYLAGSPTLPGLAASNAPQEARKRQPPFHARSCVSLFA